MKERVLNGFLLKAKVFLFAITVFTIVFCVLTGNVIDTKATDGIPFTDKPDIRLSRGDLPTIKANQEFVLTLHLDNVGNVYGVNRGKITVTVPEGLSIRDQSNIYFIDGTGIPVRGSNKIEVKLKAADKISVDSFQIGVTLDYTYWGREGMASGNESYNVILPAKKTKDEDTKNDGAPIIQVVRDKIKPVKAKEEHEFDIAIKNINKKVKAKDVKITLSAAAGFSVKGRESNYFIEELEYNDPYILPIKIKSAKTIETDRLELTVNVSYTYNQGGTLAQGNDSERITLPSVITEQPKKEDEEAANKLTPNIIVSSYNYGDKVEAGKIFALDLSFKNTSKDTSVENIVMSINTAEGISVASSSNSFYFDKLEAGGILPLKVELKAWEEAKSAAAVLTINFNYEYRSGKNVTKGTTSESISIPVVQPDRFEIGEVESVGEAFVGEEFYFSIPYVNKGKATTSNINAKIEGEGFECLSKEVWVGNCNSGANGTIDIILIPFQMGDCTAKIKIEYEDANAKKKTKEIEVPFFAQEMMPETPMEPEIEDMMPEQTENPKQRLIKISVVTVLVIVVLIIVIKILKKRAGAKKMERLSHMYDWATKGDDKQTSESKSSDKNEADK